MKKMHSLISFFFTFPFCSRGRDLVACCVLGKGRMCDRGIYCVRRTSENLRQKIEPDRQAYLT